MSRKADPITKLISDIRKSTGYRKCTRCNGTGHVMLPPHYATIMPKPVEYPCETCHGTGKLYVVPDDAVIVRKSNYY